jgi:hypothetical protein
MTDSRPADRSEARAVTMDTNAPLAGRSLAPQGPPARGRPFGLTCAPPRGWRFTGGCESACDESSH